MTKTDAPSSVDTHWRNCIVRNRLTAYSALAYSMALLWGACSQLHRPFPVVHVSFKEHWVLGYGTILMLFLFWRVRCTRERLWLGMALSYDAMRTVRMLNPGFLAPAAGVIGVLSVLLWVMATMLSLYFVVSTQRNSA